MRTFMARAVVILTVVLLAVTAFHCGSTEMTTAKLAIQQKQYDKAEASLLQAVQKNSNDEEAWFFLGQVRQETKHFEGMIDAYNHALQISDVHKAEITSGKRYAWSVMVNDGVQKFNTGRDFGQEKEDSARAQFLAAITSFKTAIVLQPDSILSYHLMAVAYLAIKDFPNAVGTLNQLLEKRPSSAADADLLGQVHFRKANDLLSNGDTVKAKESFKLAEGAFEKAYEAEPDSVSYVVNLVEACEQAGDIEKAKSITADAIDKDPDNKFFRLASGIFNLKQGKFPQAVDQLKKAVEIDPDYYEARYNLGVAYLKWGDALRKAVGEATQPTGKKGKNKPAAPPSADWKEKFQEALPHMEKLVALRPKDIALWIQLGHLYTVLNMTDKSKAAFEQVDRLSGK